MASRPTRHTVDLRGLDMVKCDSMKVGFPTYDAALTAAERLMELGRVKPGCHITPYECDRCGEWHVYNRIVIWLGKNQRQ